MKKRSIDEAMIIRANCERVGIRSDSKLAEYLNMRRETLCLRRMKMPGEFRLYELRAIIKTTGMSDEDILTLVRG